MNADQAIAITLEGESISDALDLFLEAKYNVYPTDLEKKGMKDLAAQAADHIRSKRNKLENQAGRFAHFSKNSEGSDKAFLMSMAKKAFKKSKEV